MNALPFLAAVTTGTLVEGLIWLAAAAVLFYLCNWFIKYIELGEPFLTPAKVIIGVIILLLLLRAFFVILGRPSLGL